MFRSECSGRRRWGEALWLVAPVVCLALLTSLPPLVGWWQARGSGLRYTGVPELNAADLAFYLSYIRQAGRGHLAFDYPLLSGVGTPVVNWVWLMVGGLGRMLGTSPLLTYHLARLALLVPLVLAVRSVVRNALPRALDRRVAMLLLLFGSGCGAWMALLGGTASLLAPDVEVAEFTIFASALTSPHLLVSWIFLLVVVPMAIRAASERSVRLACWAGVLSACWFQFHLFYLPLVWTITGAAAVWVGRGRWRNVPWHVVILVVLGGTPALVYHVPIIFGANQEWMYDSNTLPTGPFALLLLAVAGVLLCAPRGYRQLKAQTIPRATSEGASRRAGVTWLSPDLLVLWATVQVVCAYLPLGFERRLLEGLVVPLTLLAAPAIAGWVIRGSTEGTWRRSWRWSVLPLAFGSGLVFLLTTSITSVMNPVPGIRFLPADFADVVRWGEANLASEQVVVAPPRASHFLAGWAGATVYVGEHWTHSATERTRTAEVDAFYRATDAVAVTEFLRGHDVGAVLIGGEQRGFDAILARVPGSSLLVRSGRYSLWSVSARRAPAGEPGS